MNYPTGVNMDSVLREETLIIFDRLVLKDGRKVTVVGFEEDGSGEIEVMEPSGNKFYVWRKEIAKKV